MGLIFNETNSICKLWTGSSDLVISSRRHTQPDFIQFFYNSCNLITHRANTSEETCRQGIIIIHYETDRIY